MKLSISQALATVLNIQVARVPLNDREAFAVSNVIGIHLGYCDEMSLEQAVCKAVIECDLKQPSGFAIFPIGSGRENIYMAIERELLRQEQALGHQMWTQLGDDPRVLVTLIMEQLRECATSVVNPSLFQIALLRVCCLCIASMSWVSDWLVRLNVKATVLQQQRKQQEIPTPTAVDDKTEKVPAEPLPPLFGAGGPGAIKVLPDPEPIDISKCAHGVSIDAPCAACIGMASGMQQPIDTEGQS